jgi:hypothetical protein
MRLIAHRIPASSWNERAPAGLSVVRTALAVNPAQRAFVAGILFVTDKEAHMLAFQILGGIFVLLFLAAAMTGIEGNEHR